MAIAPYPDTRRRLRAVLVAAALVPALVAPVRAADPAPAADPLAEHEQDIDAAIERGLKYLLSKQQDNGAFACPMEGNTAVTSLCVMAFLAKGYTPETPPHGEALNRAIDYVVSAQNDSGLLVAKGRSHGPMYSHGISTLMLSEVSGMLSPERQRRVGKALSKALALILQAQDVEKKDPRHQGGWRYQPHSRDSDISCTGWQIMALRSARTNGAPVPADAIDDAVKHVLRCRDEKSGGFCYMPGKSPGLARTGTGLLCLELTGRHGTAPTVQAGKWLLKHLPNRWGGGHFYYGIYYCSQGMFQLGEDYWHPWADRLYRIALKTQREDGSWPTEAGSAKKAGPTYATAMTILAVSVAYRQLPIYQR
ncbi:MAG: prenyltransferase/squalene oxidase repeat-containing protein [Planctomycetota bacterium]